MTRLPLLFSVGHSNHLSERFLALLEQHRIRTIVDVRTAPYSRFAPHFNSDALHLSLAQRDIQYVFAGKVLGGRPSDPIYYKNGVVPRGKADYLNLVDYAAIAREDWFQRGINRLVDIATVNPTAMLCSEEDPRRCHRHHLIEHSLHERGFTVAHIRRDGSLEELSARAEEVVASPPQLALAGFEE